MNLPKGNSLSLLTGVVIGALYGLTCQFSLKTESLKDIFGIMTLGFVFVLPVCLGAITIYFAPDSARSSWTYRIFMPWATASLFNYGNSNLSSTCLFRWDYSRNIFFGSRL